MSTKGKKSVVKQMIDEALGKVDNSGFPQDPELRDDDDRQLTGPERFAKGQKAKDEVIIDSQLADIQGKEGYFLKLKKEMRPNEWMLMKTIETEWRKWPDIETEVARIVKEHTKTAPIKWGTGPYKIEYACKGGIRGRQYPELSYYINAEEEFLTPTGISGQPVAAPIDASLAVAGQIDTLANLVGMLKNFLPQAADPAKTQDQIAGAFEKGLQIKANEGSSNNQMMMTMMTGMMGMMTALATNKPVVEAPKVVNPVESLAPMLEVMKTFGVLGNNTQEKPKSFTDTLVELKAIGIDIFKKDDPMEQMGKLKQFASIASDLMGMGGTSERPSVLEKVVDMLGPAIPSMIKDAKDAMNSAATAQVEAGRNIERAKIAGPQPISGEGPSMHTAPNTQPTTNPQIVAFFNGLHDATRANNRLYYPIVYASLVSDPQGVALIDGIVKETHTAKELIEMLQGYGDARFKDSEFVMKHLVGYVNGFIVWLRDMVKPRAYAEMAQEQMSNPALTNGHVAPKGPGFDVICPVCRQEFVLGSAEELNDEENKICGQNGCVGALQPLTKV